MAVAEPVTAEHAQEYVRLVNGGNKPGGDTMRQARENVANRYAGTVKEDEAIEAAGGGPEDPVADAGVIANTLRKVRSVGGKTGSGIASLGRQVSTPSSIPRRVYGQVSTPSGSAQTITKLIWAVALGLIVLEVASQATGQYWSFGLPNKTSLVKGGYKPLYSGQQSGGTTTQAATVPSAIPAVSPVLV